MGSRFSTKYGELPIFPDCHAGRRDAGIPKVVIRAFRTPLSVLLSVWLLLPGTWLSAQAQQAGNAQTPQLKPPLPNGTSADKGADAGARMPQAPASDVPAATNPPLSPDPTATRPNASKAKDAAQARKLTSTVYQDELKIQSLDPGQKAPSPMPPFKGAAEKPYGEGEAITPPMETIDLQKPELKALVTVSNRLDPFGLDASSAQVVALRDVLKSSVQHNLTIADSRAQTAIQKFTYLNALTGFMPDAAFNDYNFWTTGTIKLPGALGQSASAAPGGSSGSGAKIHGPFYIVGGSATYHLFQGGKVVFGSLQQRHNLRAQRAQQKATMQDTLLDATRQYYNLMLQQALLQNQIRAVATDEEQFRQNSDLEKHGLATYLDVLQAKTQLAKDRQSLIDQQTARRTAAIKLADLLNADLGQDLIPADQVVRKVRLIDPAMPVATLLRLAIDNRPELRQYEELRMAAKRNIVVQGASLWPQVNALGGIYGIGSYSLGTIYFLGLSVSWNVRGLGTTNLTSVESARWQARQSLIRAHQELITILDQVRSALLQALSTEKKIEETTEEVASAQEELRLARLRFEHGLGTNLDVLTGQRDLTAAYIDKATAIVNYNTAQAQLLHDIGLISVDTVTSGTLLK